MKFTITPLKSPNESRVLTKEDALISAGQYLAMCYERDNFDKIKNEEPEKSIKRAKSCINRGHHSGFEHIKLTFEILFISKTFAMILNNQGSYVTSEKSARYRVLSFENEREEALREKWQNIFVDVITRKHYELFENFYARKFAEPEKLKKVIDEAITKKAQENSRLITSPFAKTKMIYTINIRQLSYLRYELKDFIANEPDTPFNVILKAEMQEFIDGTEPWGLEDEGLNLGNKGIKLPFYETVENRDEEFGENYSFNYYASYATFAQLQRHRTCHYTVRIPEKKEYFIPEFIKDNEDLVNDWLADCKSVTSEDSFPQATLIYINERGRYEDFVLKCYERLCGAAQYEVSMVTKEQLKKYLENVTSENARVALEKINTGARCTFGFKCSDVCIFGPKYAFDREF